MYVQILFLLIKPSQSKYTENCDLQNISKFQNFEKKYIFRVSEMEVAIGSYVTAIKELLAVT